MSKTKKDNKKQEPPARKRTDGLREKEQEKVTKKKGKKMKKIVLTMMMALTMTMVYADNEEKTSINDANAYMMNISMHSLGRALDLSSDQYEFVEHAINAFTEDMMSIAASEGADRMAMVRNAVRKNLNLTHSILTRAQYRKYVMLLNTTLNNRGLNK